MAQRKQKPNGAARGGGIVERLLKLGGLVVALDEILFHGGDRHFSLVLAVAALMITGGQGIAQLIDRLLGK